MYKVENDNLKNKREKYRFISPGSYCEHLDGLTSFIIHSTRVVCMCSLPSLNKLQDTSPDSFLCAGIYIGQLQIVNTR